MSFRWLIKQLACVPTLPPDMGARPALPVLLNAKLVMAFTSSQRQAYE